MKSRRHKAIDKALVKINKSSVLKSWANIWRSELEEQKK